MRSFVQYNVTLLEEDGGELYLSIADEIVPLAVQTYAILPGELERIAKVIADYQQATLKK